MKKEKENKNKSLRMLVVYVSIVLVFIVGALAIRVVTIVKDSKYDGVHRYSLAIGEGARAVGIISFEPLTYSLSLLKFDKNLNTRFDNLNNTAGIISDGYINVKYPVNVDNSIPSLLQLFILNLNQSEQNITFYDLARFWMYASKIPVSTIQVYEVNADSDPDQINKSIGLLFKDTALSSENLSIRIVNGSGHPGLGNRLERALTNIGANVVSVESSDKIENISKIFYYGEESYTSKKLQRLLGYQTGVMNKRDIADILVIIGENSKDSNLF